MWIHKISSYYKHVFFIWKLVERLFLKFSSKTYRRAKLWIFFYLMMQKTIICALLTTVTLCDCCLSCINAIYLTLYLNFLQFFLYPICLGSGSLGWLSGWPRIMVQRVRDKIRYQNNWVWVEKYGLKLCGHFFQYELPPLDP